MLLLSYVSSIWPSILSSDENLLFDLSSNWNLEKLHSCWGYLYLQGVNDCQETPEQTENMPQGLYISLVAWMRVYGRGVGGNCRGNKVTCGTLLALLPQWLWRTLKKWVNRSTCRWKNEWQIWCVQMCITEANTTCILQHILKAEM